MRKNILTSSKKKKALELLQARRLPEAKDLYVQICRIDPADADAWSILGAVNGMLNLHREAADCFQRSLAINPSNPETYYNFGIALRSLEKPEDAEAAFRQALKLRPEYPDALECLAHALLNRGVLDESADLLQKAIRLRPNNAEWHSNLGTIFQTKGLLDQAIACYRTAQRLKPGSNIAIENIGSTLTSQGRIDEALAAYREGLRRDPHNSRLRSNYLMALNYVPKMDPGVMSEEHREWGRVHGKVTQISCPGARVGNPDAPIRVGYISPDFREHSVSNFFVPLLEKRDRDGFRIVCYSDVPHPDRMTDHLRSLSDDWRDVCKLDHDQVARLVRDDAVDILVDLAGHTANNRLMVFAAKPAPVQVTYIGYPNTTGLSAIDYRLTDAISDPPGSDAYYTERLVRLPGCFLCYAPPENCPEVGPLPARVNGYITFGSFNNLAKINVDVVAAWSLLLQKVARSRLLVKNHSLTDSSTRNRYAALFAQHGIDAGRVELVGHTRSRDEHLAMYRRVDIALDTFPYNGTTTTCEALWMGVPVITFAGDAHATRVGASLLDAIGLREYVAGNADEYISVAVRLADQVEKLAGLRQTLRDQMGGSRLCDAKTFMKNLESAFRSCLNSTSY